VLIGPQDLAASDLPKEVVLLC